MGRDPPMRMATTRRKARARAASQGSCARGTKYSQDMAGADDHVSLDITWQRLVDDHGCTCPRCGSTGEAVRDARNTLAAALAPLGIDVTVSTREISDAEFRADPSQSHRIWLAGRPLEAWLGATSGSSPCCDQCGDDPCRTVEVDGETLEAIPADVIVRAGLIAAASIGGDHG